MEQATTQSDAVIVASEQEDVEDGEIEDERDAVDAEDVGLVDAVWLSSPLPPAVVGRPPLSPPSVVGLPPLPPPETVDR